MMSLVEEFLTLKDELEIVQAIRQAERNTSGEIRVHLENFSKISHYNRALEVFRTLEMFNTKEQNAVLIYIAVKDHKFVIYGDKGINTIVANDFWDTTKNVMQIQFQAKNFKQGIIDGVLKVGEELKKHFPCQINDEDELPNEISKV